MLMIFPAIYLDGVIGVLLTTDTETSKGLGKGVFSLPPSNFEAPHFTPLKIKNLDVLVSIIHRK